MWIKDNVSLRNIEVPLCGLPRVEGRFLKAKCTAWNEIAAYQLAHYLELPVPPVSCFLPSERLLVGGEDIEGRPCLLIDDVHPNSSGISISEAHCPQEIKARFLAFAVFDRGHEWPEIVSDGSSVWFLDLESQFAHFYLDEGMSRSSLLMYTIYGDSAVRECYECAEKMGMKAPFIEYIKEFVDKIEKRFRPNFGPCPHCEQIESFFIQAMHSRISSIANLLNWEPNKTPEPTR